MIEKDYACERVVQDIVSRDFIMGTVPCKGGCAPSTTGMERGSILCASLLSPGTARCGP